MAADRDLVEEIRETVLVADGEWYLRLDAQEFAEWAVETGTIDMSWTDEWHVIEEAADKFRQSL